MKLTYIQDGETKGTRYLSKLLRKFFEKKKIKLELNIRTNIMWKWKDNLTAYGSKKSLAFTMFKF